MKRLCKEIKDIDWDVKCCMLLLSTNCKCAVTNKSYCACQQLLFCRLLSALVNMSANFIFLFKVTLHQCVYVHEFVCTGIYIFNHNQHPVACIANIAIAWALRHQYKQNTHSFRWEGVLLRIFFASLLLWLTKEIEWVSKGYWEIIACAIISWKQHRRRLLRLHCKKARIIDNVALTRWWKISDLYPEQGTWSFYYFRSHIMIAGVQRWIVILFKN